MDNWQRNLEVIARGGGSDQARAARECCRGGNCPVCNPKSEDEDGD